MKITHTITFTDATTETSTRSKIAGAIVLAMVTASSKVALIERENNDLTDWINRTSDGYGSWTADEIENSTDRKRSALSNAQNIAVGSQYVASWHGTSNAAAKGGIRAARVWCVHALSVVALDENGNVDLS